jgi:hypothetical protein
MQDILPDSHVCSSICLWLFTTSILIDRLSVEPFPSSKRHNHWPRSALVALLTMMPQMVPSPWTLILWPPWLSWHSLLGLFSFSWMEQNLVPEGLSHRHRNHLQSVSQEKDIASPSFTALPLDWEKEVISISQSSNLTKPRTTQIKMLIKGPAPTSVILNSPQAQRSLNTKL